MSWDETIEWSQLLDIKTVPVLYDGIWDEELIKNLHKEERNGDLCEGYVVRIAGSFPYTLFRKSYAKYVRKDHVGTHEHWIHDKIIPNEMKSYTG